MTPTDRALMPDYLRLIAVFGIVVVNVQFIAFSALPSLTDPVWDGTADAVTLWLVYGLALLKTYGLFAFMFGVGLGFLIRSAERRGLAFGTLYRNRILGLLGLGVLHGVLFFPGDILFIYGLMGAILYRFRAWSVRRLVRMGTGLLIVFTVFGTPLFLLPSETPPDFIAFERAALAEGGFADAAVFRAIGFAFVMPTALITQGVAALGWFCLGLAAVKSGMIDQPMHPMWAQARRWCLVPGVLLSLLGAAIWLWVMPVVGAAVTIVVAPIATIGYLGAIAALPHPKRPWATRVLKAGGSSLSIYLGQSIILSTIFAAYGLDLWEEVSRATATLIAIAVTALLIGCLTLWHRYQRLGPFEWGLRKITYAGQAKSPPS